ncbi:hypothetical protein Phi17218_034 [Cellulophaga phage phi17:2_18]|uniref:Uncharacterized protein n=2 Tax=Lightbulbvirus Cba172 TaxID=1918525 RepID=R9ZZ96_9CAUD|nr:hypothetical protein Phi17:2_gp034 [Cellulophaga phage phi17:2]AGO47567.1 hypothetical protein Phi17:2_gp034 [Cellulophaga phage phi17:2]ALO80437.1 hypothetical protein Phi17218_034 [Cellulophaga phage phi17:2_18]
MTCPNCNKNSRCGCRSCKARVKYPSNRAYKVTGIHEGIVQCPYCRQRFTEGHLMDLEYEKRKKI